MYEQRIQIITETEDHEKDVKGREASLPSPILHHKISKLQMVDNCSKPSVRASNRDFESSPPQVSSGHEDVQGITGQTLAEHKTVKVPYHEMQKWLKVPHLQVHKVLHLQVAKQQKVSHPKVKKQQGHEEPVKVPHLEVQKLVYSVVKELWEMNDLGEGPKFLAEMPKTCPSELFLQSLTCAQHLKMSIRRNYCKVRQLGLLTIQMKSVKSIS